MMSKPDINNFITCSSTNYGIKYVVLRQPKFQPAQRKNCFDIFHGINITKHLYFLCESCSLNGPCRLKYNFHF